MYLELRNFGVALRDLGIADRNFVGAADRLELAAERLELAAESHELAAESHDLVAPRRKLLFLISIEEAKPMSEAMPLISEIYFCFLHRRLVSGRARSFLPKPALA